MVEKKDNKKSNLNRGNISKLINFVQSNMDKMYGKTYYSQKDNKLDLDHLKDNIDTSIDKIMNNNMNTIGSSNISQLYSRIQDRSSGGNGEKKVINELEKLFDEKSLTDGLMMSVYNDNKYIKDMDEEIDLICKYMPQLDDALDAKKDNVLASDHFSKDFVNVLNSSNIKSDGSFNERIKVLKKKYNVIDLFETLYDRTEKYGEQFVYVVPYKKALSKLLQNKPNINVTSTQETSVLEEAVTQVFQESLSSILFDTNSKKIINESKAIQMSNIVEEPIGKLTANFNLSGVLESAITDHMKATKVLKKQSSNKLAIGNLSFEGIDGQESIIGDSKENNMKVNIPGCIVKIVPRENVVPIYIDNLCLGYYIIESDSSELFNDRKGIDPLLSFKNNKSAMDGESAKKDNIIKYISNQLSTHIDAKFINANQDLTKEIYMILKGNDLLNGRDHSQLKITFVSPEDMVHMYFNKDLKTNRGVSGLHKSLLAAKLYTTLYVTNTVGYLTRGFDKRVYYVKQNIETNISQTLLNTINQIKKSNFGARELTNVKTMLNMTGRYNDYVIPVGSSGESPINFEIMQGQNIEIKTELMNILEQMAINGTDVPYEYIQARQTVDYAVRLTMSSGKFLRKCFKRQGKSELFFSDIITKIYNSEYEDNDYLEVVLPPPAFLNILNTDTMLDNTNRYVEDIVNSEAGNEDDAFKMELTRKLKRWQLNSFVDYEAVDRIKEQTRLELKVNNSNQEQ